MIGFKRPRHFIKQAAIGDREADHERRQEARVCPEQKPKDQNQKVEFPRFSFQIEFSVV
jgi:hypothetical protein